MARVDKNALEYIKATIPISSVFERFGYRVTGRGSRAFVLCPFHPERTPSCRVRDTDSSYHCFGCGASGDQIDLVMHCRGGTFAEAIEFLGGAKPISEAERVSLEKARASARAAVERDRAGKRSAAQALFEQGRPIEGTHAAAYLSARGLDVSPGWTFDLRFIASLPYYGYARPESDDTEPLGEYPAMIAAIRSVDGALIGAHRTYLDPVRPTKLFPGPGDMARNKPKKIMGEQAHGMILLSRIEDRLAIGEGIETTVSWYQLGSGGPDIGIAAAVSLGNLAGSATGSVPHPSLAGRRVPNGTPDPDRPGIILPPRVEEVILIGDGDSDGPTTAQQLLVAGRRFAADGREVFVHMAPAGADFNDVLMRARADD